MGSMRTCGNFAGTSLELRGNLWKLCENFVKTCGNFVGTSWELGGFHGHL